MSDEQRFSIGEIAILQNARDPAENGMEVEVVALPRPERWVFPPIGKGVPANHYVIRANLGPDGHYWGCAPCQLRKKRPPRNFARELMAKLSGPDCIKETAVSEELR